MTTPSLQRRSCGLHLTPSPSQTLDPALTNSLCMLSLTFAT